MLSVTSFSCAVTDFIGAYFNTYYNARQLFTEAETDVFTQFDLRPGGRNLLAPCVIQVGTKTKFASVIEKCSKLLQYHPGSKLVDDALMMIGKAYYYSDEDQKAERKFREIIDTYPDGGLALEAKLFLSYALYRMNNKADARTMAGQIIATAETEGEREMIARASLLIGRMDFEAENYPLAAEAYTRAAENGGSAEQRFSAYLLVAEMSQRMSRYADAERAYGLAEQASDTYIGEYRGRIGILRMRARQGEYEGALEGLRGLRSKSNNKEFFGEIELEIAHTLRAMGDTTAAIEQYTVVDTTYARTEAAANAYFALGTLYETGLYRYDAAQRAYAKARSEFPQAAITAEAARRAEYLLRYSQYRSEIVKYDSLRNVLLAAPATRTPAGRDSAAVARGGGDTLRADIAAPPAIPLDTLDLRLAASKNELAGLFYATIGLPDSAEHWYRRVIVDHPRSPFVPRALFSLAQIYGRDTLVSRSRADSLLRLIIASYPETEFAAESRRLLGLPAVKKAPDEAEVMYARGESLMMAGKPAAAVDTFKTLARRYPASSYSSRALYAAGWLYENGLTSADSAIAAYEYIMTLYPGSPFALIVQPRIAEVKLQRSAAASRALNDTSAVAPVAPPGDEEELARRRREALKKATPVVPPKPAADKKKPDGKEGPTPE